MKKHIKTAALLAVSCIALFGFSACGKWSPEQGAGTLWVYKGDKTEKHEVKSVSFLTSRTTRFTDSNGVLHEVQAPVYYEAF
jgi:hypothetical protein